MKTSTLLIGASLALNAALVAVIVVGAAGESADFATGATVTATTPNTPASGTANHATPGLDTWSRLRSDNLAAQRDRLREEGFPPALIRTIVAAQVREGFAVRRKALEATQAELPYWRAPRLDPTQQAEVRALGKEEQQALRELLGPDPENGYAASLHRQFPALGTDKIDQLAAIRERYDDKRADLFAAVRGSMSPNDSAQLRALEKSMHDEFATVLTPAELEDYGLRTSSVANSLRNSLTAFDPTEAEFRALYKIQAAYDEQLRPAGSLSPEQSRTLSATMKQRDLDIAAALGPERYAEYQRASDYNYRQTTQLVARLGLPAETSATLYSLRKDYEQRRTELYRSATDAASRAQLQAQLTTMQQEAADRVASLLGSNPSYVEAYKQYGGSWLANLAPRPAAPAPARNSIP
jgi:hypothetical protein